MGCGFESVQRKTWDVVGVPVVSMREAQTEVLGAQPLTAAHDLAPGPDVVAAGANVVPRAHPAGEDHVPRLLPAILLDDHRIGAVPVVDAAFAQRRKTLRAALASWAGSAVRAGEILAAAGIESSRRGETLHIAEFAAIAAAAHSVPAPSAPTPADALAVRPRTDSATLEA